MPLRRTAALLATAASLLAAGTASASPTTLNIQRYEDPDTRRLLCRMQVKGDTATPYDWLGHVDIWVWGDDSWGDDRLGYGGRFYVDPHYGINFWMPGGCSALNEDWGEDEIYVTVTVLDRQGKFVEELRSGSVSESF